MTLVEAAALFFPDGPLTVRSFRTAANNGQLAVARVAGKDMTTPAAVRELLTPRPRDCKSPADSGSNSAQAACKRTLEELRASLRRRRTT